MAASQVALPTYRTQLLVAKEATYGTAASGTAMVPVTSITPHDKLTLLKDAGWRGSPVTSYGQAVGPLYAELDFAGDVFADTIGYWLTGVLGDITTSGTAAPYTHNIALLTSGSTQPQSYTLTVEDAVNALQFPGAMVSEVGFKFDGNGKLEYSGKATSLASVVQASPPTVSASTVPIQAAWQGISTIASSTTATILSGEWNIKRTVAPLKAVDGSQAPFQVWSGECTVEGKLTLVMQADTYRTDYTTGTTVSLDVNFQQGTGSSATQVKLHSSNCTLTDAQKNYGKSYIELDLTFEANANTTDVGTSAGYSPMKATLQNALTSGTYH